MKHFKDSPLWIQDNVCRNLSRAVTLFKLNKTGPVHNRYFITFNYRNHSRAENKCNRIYSQLMKHNATIDKMNCTSTINFAQSSYNKPHLEGYLPFKALEMVRKHS